MGPALGVGVGGELGLGSAEALGLADGVGLEVGLGSAEALGSAVGVGLDGSAEAIGLADGLGSAEAIGSADGLAEGLVVEGSTIVYWTTSQSSARSGALTGSAQAPGPFEVFALIVSTPGLAAV
ncbi:MAG TPA: hypothetical protein VIR16_09020 [Candidatus Limnocylindrales bacterium]